jgi:hypothetical protein
VLKIQGESMIGEQIRRGTSITIRWRETARPSWPSSTAPTRPQADLSRGATAAAASHLTMVPIVVPGSSSPCAVGLIQSTEGRIQPMRELDPALDRSPPSSRCAATAGPPCSMGAAVMRCPALPSGSSRARSSAPASRRSVARDGGDRQRRRAPPCGRRAGRHGGCAALRLRGLRPALRSDRHAGGDRRARSRRGRRVSRGIAARCGRSSRRRRSSGDEAESPRRPARIDAPVAGVGSDANESRARGLPAGGDAGEGPHRPRGHLPGEPHATVRSTLRRRSVESLPDSRSSHSRAALRVRRGVRSGARLRVPGNVRRRRPRWQSGDAVDQGDVPAAPRPARTQAAPSCVR